MATKPAPAGTTGIDEATARAMAEAEFASDPSVSEGAAFGKDVWVRGRILELQGRINGGRQPGTAARSPTTAPRPTAPSRASTSTTTTPTTPPSPSATDAKALAKAEWDTMAAAERSHWLSSESYVGFRSAELRGRTPPKR